MLAAQKLVSYQAKFHGVNKVLHSLFSKYIQHFLKARNHSKTLKILAHVIFTYYTGKKTEELTDMLTCSRLMISSKWWSLDRQIWAVGPKAYGLDLLYHIAF